LKPILGRLLVVVRDNPDVYKRHGFLSYDDFLRGIRTRYGISRSEAFACRKVAENFPSLSISEFEDIGISKMYSLASVTREGDRDCAVLLEKAKDHSVTRDQLRSFAAELKNIERGDLDRTEITISVSKTTARRWQQFHESPMIRAYTEADTPGAVFERMLEECGLEWTAQGQYIMESGAHRDILLGEM